MNLWTIKYALGMYQNRERFDKKQFLNGMNPKIKTAIKIVWTIFYFLILASVFLPYFQHRSFLGMVYSQHLISGYLYLLLCLLGVWLIVKNKFYEQIVFNFWIFIYLFAYVMETSIRHLDLINGSWTVGAIFLILGPFCLLMISLLPLALMEFEVIRQLHLEPMREAFAANKEKFKDNSKIDEQI